MVLIRGRLPAQRGFTLIELMVVLVLIGCLAGLALLSIGIAGNARQMQSEAQRLASLMGLLADEAVLDNTDYALQFTNSGYQVLRYDSVRDVWTSQGTQEHGLPQWLALKLSVEGRPVMADSAAKPQLIMHSSGEWAAFELNMSDISGGTALTISSDGFSLPKVAMAQSGSGR